MIILNVNFCAKVVCPRSFMEYGSSTLRMDFE